MRVIGYSTEGTTDYGWEESRDSGSRITKVSANNDIIMFHETCIFN